MLKTNNVKIEKEDLKRVVTRVISRLTEDQLTLLCQIRDEIISETQAKTA